MIRDVTNSTEVQVALWAEDAFFQVKVCVGLCAGCTEHVALQKHRHHQSTPY